MRDNVRRHTAPTLYFCSASASFPVAFMRKNELFKSFLRGLNSKMKPESRVFVEIHIKYYSFKSESPKKGMKLTLDSLDLILFSLLVPFVK